MMEQKLRQLLDQSCVVGGEVRCFDVLDSTNTYLKELALNGAPNGLAVLAEQQTAGRGRMDRRFQSPKGMGLYLSVLLRPELPPERLLPVTALAGVAVCGAVERLCGERPGLKWPNDPVLHGRKLAGILTELTVDGDGKLALVLGIGINVRQGREDFSPDVAEIATSLRMEGLAVSREALAAALLRELDKMYRALLAGELDPWREAYRQDCVNLGRPVQLLYPGGRKQAVALDIDEEFGLVVRLEDGEVTVVRSGEVSVRGLYGYVE